VRHVLVTVPLWAAVTEPMPGRGSAYGDRHMALERLIDKGGSHQPPHNRGRLPVEELKR
jgi:hypothetical protein